MSSNDLAPALLEYDPQIALGSDDMRSAQEGAFLKIPDDWQVARGYRTTIKLGFAEADRLAVPAEAGVFPAPTKDGPLVIVATDSVPMVYLQLTREDSSCHVDIAETTTELAQVWSSAVTGGGMMHATPIGRVGVGGATAVIDTGRQLILATYADESVPDVSKESDSFRMESARDGAQAFLDDLIGTTTN